jgi:hypothetical protein
MQGLVILLVFVVLIVIAILIFNIYHGGSELSSFETLYDGSISNFKYYKKISYLQRIITRFDELQANIEIVSKYKDNIDHIREFVTNINEHYINLKRQISEIPGINIELQDDPDIDNMLDLPIPEPLKQLYQLYITNINALNSYIDNNIIVPEKIIRDMYHEPKTNYFHKYYDKYEIVFDDHSLDIPIDEIIGEQNLKYINRHPSVHQLPYNLKPFKYLLDSTIDKLKPYTYYVLLYKDEKIIAFCVLYYIEGTSCVVDLIGHSYNSTSTNDNILGIILKFIAEIMNEHFKTCKYLIIPSEKTKYIIPSLIIKYPTITHLGDIKSHELYIKFSSMTFDEYSEYIKQIYQKYQEEYSGKLSDKYILLPSENIFIEEAKKYYAMHKSEIGCKEHTFLNDYIIYSHDNLYQERFLETVQTPFIEHYKNILKNIVPKYIVEPGIRKYKTSEYKYLFYLRDLEEKYKEFTYVPYSMYVNTIDRKSELYISPEHYKDYYKNQLPLLDMDFKNKLYYIKDGEKNSKMNYKVDNEFITLFDSDTIVYKIIDLIAII